MNPYKPNKTNKKMKTKVMNLILAAAALIAAAACANDDNNAVVDNDTPVPARITAAMADGAVATPDAKSANSAMTGNDAASTRAAGTRWNRDHIGVMVFKSPGSDMAARYRNARYATTSTGTTADFAPADAANTIYFADPDETVTFWAYAPYQPSADAATLPGTNADGQLFFDMRRQTTPEEQEAVDILVTFMPTTASKSNPTVAFEFTHCMSRLVLKIQTPAMYGFSPDDVERITAVKIGGLATTGYLRISDNNFSVGYDEGSRTQEWDITQNMNSVQTTGGVTQRVYTLIIPSAQYVKDKDGKNIDAIPLSITLDGQDYKNTTDLKGDLAAPGHFTFGNSYEYTINLKKTGLEVTGAKIAPWADGGTGSGDAVQE